MNRQHVLQNPPKFTPARIVLTLFGDYWWATPTAIPSGALVAALGDLGVKEPAARAGVLRLTRDGVLMSTRVGRRVVVGLSPTTAEMIVDQARWLDSFGRVAQDWDGLWSVVAFSIPERQRPLRHSARSRLKWLGYGSLYDGVWISPSNSASEAMAQLQELGVHDVTSMRAQLKTSMTNRAQDSWDLDATRAAYDEFAQHVRSPLPDDPASALADRTVTMLWWQRFRMLDVDLPLELLPDCWPRTSLRQEFATRYNELGPLAERRMREHVGNIDPDLIHALTGRRLLVSNYSTFH